MSRDWLSFYDPSKDWMLLTWWFVLTPGRGRGLGFQSSEISYKLCTPKKLYWELASSILVHEEGSDERLDTLTSCFSSKNRDFWWGYEKLHNSDVLHNLQDDVFQNEKGPKSCDKLLAASFTESPCEKVGFTKAWWDAQTALLNTFGSFMRSGLAWPFVFNRMVFHSWNELLGCEDGWYWQICRWRMHPVVTIS